MLKIAGICLVMAGCIGIGWFFSGKALRRIHLLEEWESLLQLLYGEVEYAGNDLPELMHHMMEHSRYSKGFWSRIDRQLRQMDAGRLSHIWQRELNHSEWQILQTEERHILRELGETLGQTDRQTQLHAIRLFQQRLSNVLEKEKETYRGQARVYHVAGITAGCFLVILLL
ncbi:MAG: stage III sporulation protein AB [Eubacteriales bacterium]|nr:stage III sporulation protein AB [Eubacteriales bacterium]